MDETARLTESIKELLGAGRAERLADVPTFHDDSTGGYLIWAEGPERLVYIDDRAELYGERAARHEQLK